MKNTSKKLASIARESRYKNLKKLISSFSGKRIQQHFIQQNQQLILGSICYYHKEIFQKQKLKWQYKSG